MQIKIVSDGTAPGTEILDAETGEPLENVIGITWNVQDHQLATVVIRIRHVPVEVTGTLVATVTDEPEE